ncbi:hypothetical protein EDC01DRAFT_190550 [Geopyxis carbonaria]|nr:hypothetical protein EDC01DRAFT_190550 [Geopyxis carbonaria]
MENWRCRAFHLVLFSRRTLCWTILQKKTSSLISELLHSNGARDISSREKPLFCFCPSAYSSFVVAYAEIGSTGKAECFDLVFSSLFVPTLVRASGACLDSPNTECPARNMQTFWASTTANQGVLSFLSWWLAFGWRFFRDMSGARAPSEQLLRRRQRSSLTCRDISNFNTAARVTTTRPKSLCPWKKSFTLLGAATHQRALTHGARTNSDINPGLGPLAYGSMHVMTLVVQEIVTTVFDACKPSSAMACRACQPSAEINPTQLYAPMATRQCMSGPTTSSSSRRRSYREPRSASAGTASTQHDDRASQPAPATCSRQPSPPRSILGRRCACRCGGWA